MARREETMDERHHLSQAIFMNRYRKSENVVTRRIAEQTILVPVTANVAELDSFYMLNDLGTRVWELIDREKNLDQIVETITGEYEVGSEEAMSSVVEFLNSLCDAKLIASESRTVDAAT
jgi:hypothetical protein